VHGFGDVYERCRDDGANNFRLDNPPFKMLRRIMVWHLQRVAFGRPIFKTSEMKPMWFGGAMNTDNIERWLHWGAEAGLALVAFLAATDANKLLTAITATATAITAALGFLRAHSNQKHRAAKAAQRRKPKPVN